MPRLKSAFSSLRWKSSADGIVKRRRLPRHPLPALRADLSRTKCGRGVHLQEEDRHQYQQDDDEDHRPLREMGEAVPETLTIGKEGFRRLDRCCRGRGVLGHAASVGELI